MGNDLGDGRHDQDGMSDESNGNGRKDGTESTPVLIGHKGTEQRHDVGPELVN